MSIQSLIKPALYIFLVYATVQVVFAAVDNIQPTIIERTHIADNV